MAVGMTAIEETNERAIGDRTWHVAQLRRAGVTGAGGRTEVRFARAGRAAISASIFSAGPVNRLRRGNRQDRASRRCPPSRAEARVFVNLIADRSPPPSSSMSTVIAASLLVDRTSAARGAPAASA